MLVLFVVLNWSLHDLLLIRVLLSRENAFKGLCLTLENYNPISMSLFFLFHKDEAFCFNQTETIFFFRKWTQFFYFYNPLQRTGI